ncbi:MAG: hypothetical protein E6Q97_19010 [Desulfurellales bacterium]|nr:MAG: hypothetical protein E6Q97_19010 [Desulfurellales bacterium]
MAPRTPYPMHEDRFFTDFKKLVRRVLDDSDDLDFAALYPARIVKWQSSDIFPSGVVDVVFISDDARQSATKVVSINNVPLVPPFPGCSYRPQVGSQCLVGWQGADERLPYVTGWLGLGGTDETNVGSGSVSIKTTSATTINSGLGHVDIVASAVNMGDATGGQTLGNQAFVTAVNALAVAIGVYAAAVAVVLPVTAPAAATLATAISAFSGALATYTTTKTKAT